MNTNDAEIDIRKVGDISIFAPGNIRSVPTTQGYSKLDISTSDYVTDDSDKADRIAIMGDSENNKFYIHAFAIFIKPGDNGCPPIPSQLIFENTVGEPIIISRF